MPMMLDHDDACTFCGTTWTHLMPEEAHLACSEYCDSPACEYQDAMAHRPDAAELDWLEVR